MKIKQLIRQFAIWLNARTEAWVLSKNIYVLLDENNFAAAEAMLEQAEHCWPNDPHIIFAQTLLQFKRGDD